MVGPNLRHNTRLDHLSVRVPTKPFYVVSFEKYYNLNFCLGLNGQIVNDVLDIIWCWCVIYVKY